MIPGYFDNACANCQVRNWRSMCDHNPKSKDAQPSLPLRPSKSTRRRRAAREAMVGEASVAQQSDYDLEGEPANAVVRQGLASEVVE